MHYYEVIFETESDNKGKLYVSDLSEVLDFFKFLLAHYDEIDLLVNRIEK